MLLGQKLDTKTKFKLLDMIDSRPIQLIDKLDPENNNLTDERMNDLVNNE